MQHPEDHDITALAYDLIEGPEREALLGHLAECDRCRAVYDSYRDEQVAVREAIVHPSQEGVEEYGDRHDRHVVEELDEQPEADHAGVGDDDGPVCWGGDGRSAITHSHGGGRAL